MKILVSTLFLCLAFASFSQNIEKHIERSHYYLNKGFVYQQAIINSPTAISELDLKHLYETAGHREGYVFAEYINEKSVRVYFTSNFRVRMLNAFIDRYIPKARLSEVTNCEEPFSN